MQLIFLILAHKNPTQVKRLLEKLTHPCSHFYIHIDKNVDIRPFYKEISTCNNLHFIPEAKRQLTIWGDISIVNATLELLRECLANHNNGYCILLSGQDYPIKPIEKIYSFFLHHNGKEYINHFSLPDGRWEKGGVKRIKHYKINLSVQRGEFKLLPSVFLREFYTTTNFSAVMQIIEYLKIKDLLHCFKKRAFPQYLTPFGGSQWWALTTETAKKIMEYVSLHKDYLSYHKYTLIPDEIFFHSIVMAIHRENEEVLRETITYANWINKTTDSLPVTFTVEYINEIISLPENVLFARKFDLEKDSIVLDFIDNTLLK